MSTSAASETKAITKIADSYAKFARWVAVISGVVVLFLMLYTTADVIGRYGFNYPVPGAYEYSLIFLIYIAYFGFTLVQARGGHLRLAMLWERSGPRGKALIDLLSVIIGFFVFGIGTWQGWLWAIESWQIKESTMGVYDVSLFPARIGLAIGGSIFVVQYVIDLIKHASVLLSKREGGATE